MRRLHQRWCSLRIKCHYMTLTTRLPAQWCTKNCSITWGDQAPLINYQSPSLFWLVLLHHFRVRRHVLQHELPYDTSNICSEHCPPHGGRPYHCGLALVCIGCTERSYGVARELISRNEGLGPLNVGIFGWVGVRDVRVRGSVALVNQTANCFIQLPKLTQRA